MSLFALFDIGKSAIYSSQTALNVVSNNIANVNTPGYSKHEAVLKIANPIEYRGDYIGRGVGDVQIKRHYDSFVHLQIIGQKMSYGRSYSLEQGLSQIEQVFNEAKDLGLLGQMEEYFNAWQDVATNPEGAAQRTALLSKADALINVAKQMQGDIKDSIKFINDEISDVVSSINSITTNIASLNQKIIQMEGGSSVGKASYLRDERDKLLNELAELTNYDWFEDSKGSVTVLLSGRALVSDTQAYQLDTSLDTDGNRNITYNGNNINSVIQQGRLGGLIDVRDDIDTTPLYRLRKMVASLVKETNTLHQSGYGLDGTTANNFFDTLQLSTKDNSSAANITSSIIADMSSLTLDEYDINFTGATTYEVRNNQTNALVTSGTYTSGGIISFEGIEVVITGTAATDDSFFVSPLTGVIDNFGLAISDTQKIAAASADTTLPGDNRNALLITQLSRSGVTDLSGATYDSYYRGIVSTVGVMGKSASDGLTYDDNLVFELEKKRDAISGVSLDEEAANLIKFQRAFEAGARIMKVTDELLEMIINL